VEPQTKGRSRVPGADEAERRGAMKRLLYRFASHGEVAVVKKEPINTRTEIAGIRWKRAPLASNVCLGTPESVQVFE
jgi:hypothetical protein